MSDDAVRIGVIGAGAVAQVAHLATLPKLKRVEIVALCDNDLAKARALASRVGIPEVYDDMVDLLRMAQPGAVAVCTPNHLHEVHVVSALEAGAHVLCERPVALTVAGVERIRAVRERTGRFVLVGMNHRFRRDVQAAVSFLEGGELGDLTAIRCGWYMFRPIGPELGWRSFREQSGGGAVLDLGVPLIDLALWVGGSPPVKTVAAHLTPGADEHAVEDAGCVLIGCEGGLSIFVDVSWRHVGDEEKVWFELIGSRGSAKLGPLRVFKDLHGTPVDVTPTGAHSRENVISGSYRAEWAHFLAAVRGEIAPPELDEHLALHRVLEAIGRSHEEGHEIQL